MPGAGHSVPFPNSANEAGTEIDDLVAIARVVKPKGLKGEVVADVLTDFPERFEGLENVAAVLPGSDRLRLKIEYYRFQNDRIVLKFAGLDSIEDVEKLRDSEVCVTGSEAVELEEGEFYDWQLEGCAVETISGESIGTVRELQRTGGTENLLVAGVDKEFLIPFAESICVDVNIDARLIRIDPPEGLLEF
jgi:16S rRNA processing protein RimM